MLIILNILLDGDWVFVCWMNNMYYCGYVELILYIMEIEVLFIDGIRIIYFDEDKIVIIVDEFLVKVDVR